MTERQDLPAIVRTPTREHHPGKVVWHDLITDDIASAERFYGQLFDWTFFPGTPGNGGYVMAYLRDHPVGGFVTPSGLRPASMQPAWLTYIAADRFAPTVARAEANGAHPIAAAKEYKSRGEQQVFADPMGAVFAIMATSQGDPRDHLVEPGEWLWSALITSDPNADSVFYAATFGYQLFDSRPAPPATASQVILAEDGYARGSVNAFPPDTPALHSRWINFVRVMDVEETASRAMSLGGRVVVTPHHDRHGGRSAILADPSGALVGVMEWPQWNRIGTAK